MGTGCKLRKNGAVAKIIPFLRKNISQSFFYFPLGGHFKKQSKTDLKKKIFEKLGVALNLKLK